MVLLEKIDRIGLNYTMKLLLCGADGGRTDDLLNAIQALNISINAHVLVVSLTCQHLAPIVD